MITRRITPVAITLSIAFGFVHSAGSTQASAKDQNLSGTVASSKRMAGGTEWTITNLKAGEDGRVSTASCESVARVSHRNGASGRSRERVAV